MEILENQSLKEWAWWKIGGPADYFCLPKTPEQVVEAVVWARTKGLPITVLGGGTNCLISDDGVEGLVICMRQLVGSSVSEQNGRLLIQALAGTPKAVLTKNFLQRQLAPALFMCGLPGDVGGGVVMNAGVGEMITPREFVEITDWVEVLDLNTMQIRRLESHDLKWSYRHTDGWQPGIILRAGFSWEMGADPDIPRKVKEATRNRLARQPLDLPSCGSTFRNPPGHKAGALIEQAGLKGHRVGGAQVSPKHANFIVNLGGATAQEVWTIISLVRSEVQQQFGVSLETEVKLLGRWPDL